jgi:hypothetical protein
MMMMMTISIEEEDDDDNFGLTAKDASCCATSDGRLL